MWAVRSLRSPDAQTAARFVRPLPQALNVRCPRQVECEAKKNKNMIEFDEKWNSEGLAASSALRYALKRSASLAERVYADEALRFKVKPESVVRSSFFIRARLEKSVRGARSAVPQRTLNKSMMRIPGKSCHPACVASRPPTLFPSPHISIRYVSLSRPK